MQSYDAGIVANDMAVIAQNTCERYLKYIVETIHRKDEVRSEQYQKLMHTHNLKMLLRHLGSMGVELGEDAALSGRLTDIIFRHDIPETIAFLSEKKT